MRNLKFALFVGLLFGIQTRSEQNLNAKIKIDVERKVGEINSSIYGNFTEYLAKCLYGGIYDPTSKKRISIDLERI